MKSETTTCPQGFTIWLTGLSGAGKSTLAKGLEAYLLDLSLECEVLDGDEVRQELSPDLGFSKEDRYENIRRLGYLARLLNRHRIIAIVAAISPYWEAREDVRRKCANFLEVFVDCSLPVLIERDVKSLYKRALDGELKAMTGISDPYEPPATPEVHVNTDRESIAESLRTITASLTERHWIPAKQAPAPSTQNVNTHNPMDKAAFRGTLPL